VNPTLVVDATGCGLPVVQLLDEADLKPIKVQITAGSEQTKINSRLYHVAKSVLISHLDAVLHMGELKFATALLEASAMAEELAGFDRHVGTAGRATYAARTGQHDDLVLSVALGVWWASQKKPHLRVGAIRGLF
jgi:hypothetical protein